MPLSPFHAKSIMTALALAAGTVTPAFAADLTMKNTDAAPPPASGWRASTHFGFAVVDRSSTGFEDSTGSMAFFDVGYAVTKRVTLGLRTIAQGGKATEQEYYRLGTGPLLSWHVANGWAVELCFSTFNETAFASGAKDTGYRSRGEAWQIGWERLLRLGKRLDFAWGGFVMQHRGSLDFEVEDEAAMSRFGDAAVTQHVNEGLTHGVEAALRFRL